MSNLEVMNDLAVELGLHRIWNVYRMHNGLDPSSLVQIGYDEVVSAVVVARDEHTARTIVSRTSGDEGREVWLDEQLVRVIAFGWALPPQVEGIVVYSFRAG